MLNEHSELIYSLVLNFRTALHCSHTIYFETFTAYHLYISFVYFDELAVKFKS
jgi:hypothetical protein